MAQRTRLASPNRQPRPNHGAKPRAASPRRSTAPRRGFLWRHRRFLFLLWLLAFFAIAGTAYLLSRVALPPAIAPDQSSFIYDANNRQLASLGYCQDRVPVRLH